MISPHAKKSPGRYIVALSILAAAGFGVLFMAGQEENTAPAVSEERPTAQLAVPVPSDTPVVSPESEPIKSDGFALPEPVSKSKSDEVPKESLPFTEDEIFQFLDQIHLDEQGNLITDHITLQALQNFLGHDSDQRLSKEHLDLFRELIMESLPGSVGAQLAELAANYHEYTSALSEHIKEMSNNKSRGKEKEQYEQMVALRHLYFGDETARQLFGKAETDSSYMMESMQIQMDAKLSAEQKKQRQAEVTQRQIEDTMTTLELTTSYQHFADEKRRILQESTDPAEVEHRLQAALKEHFTAKQIEQISHLPLVLY